VYWHQFFSSRQQKNVNRVKFTKNLELICSTRDTRTTSSGKKNVFIFWIANCILLYVAMYFFQEALKVLKIEKISMLSLGLSPFHGLRHFKAANAVWLEFEVEI
jgi:hypothetical protein